MNARYSKSKALFARASEVIPGGIYGHSSPVMTVPGEFPYFASKAKGCRYWDVDGHEYIDLMCGYGPIYLGYQNEEVNEAASKVQRDGDCFNHPTEYSVQLAEKLTELVDIADWAVFGKNGSDMTSWAVRVAREQTGRKRIAMASHAYHGIAPWCVPGFGGVIAEDRSTFDKFYWNDPDSLDELMASSGEKLAAIIITPFHHPAFGDSVLPTPEFVAAINRIRNEYGILLIIDDVRCGFRLSLGGSHRVFGYEPDLICFSKAIANGYSLSACVGRSSLKVAASKTFLTGSFWNSASSLAAALKTIEIAERDNVVEALEERGNRLIEGMLELGQKRELPLQSSGPAAIPYIRVADDHSFHKQQALCAAAAEKGLFLHPHHNWFLSAAHTEPEIDEALQRFDLALSAVQREQVCAL
ncbi:MAG: aminotransferase class III-fold pyridoxal phosphate-dependent enzyme [Verrucomicrobiota bacterium]